MKKSFKCDIITECSVCSEGKIHLLYASDQNIGENNCIYKLVPYWRHLYSNYIKCHKFL